MVKIALVWGKEREKVEPTISTLIFFRFEPWAHYNHLRACLKPDSSCLTCLLFCCQIFSKEYINMLLTIYFFFLGIFALAHIIRQVSSSTLCAQSFWSLPELKWHWYILLVTFYLNWSSLYIASMLSLGPTFFHGKFCHILQVWFATAKSSKFCGSLQLSICK